MPVSDVIHTIGDRLRALFASAPRRSGEGMDIPAPAPDPHVEEARRIATTYRFDGTKRMLLPHGSQFAGRYSTGQGVYWSRSDEALRDNWQNALAMRRSSFIDEILSHRQMPTVALPWHIEVDDPKDPEQAKVAERLTHAIEAIPFFANLRLYLAESLWYGKYGSQLTWGKVAIDGRPMVTVVDHEPVHGDSIVYKMDKTPGILVRSDWSPMRGDEQKNVQSLPKELEIAKYMDQADRARAFFLHDPYFRDHFIIQNFQPRSTDYQFEGDLAASIFGVGFRSRLYWDFQLREELRSWRSDAMQRIGVNGMLYGFYESGNQASLNQVMHSLRLIIRDNVTAFPVEKGQPPQEIRNIEPSQVGYDILAACVTELEESMRRAVLGQSLSSEAQSTGMGSEVASLHEQTFQHIQRFDAAAQAETLTRDLIGPLVRMNDWAYRGQVLRGNLPFRCRLLYSIDKADAKERADIINVAYNLGMPIDIEQAYTDLGLSAPKDPANVLKKPDQQAVPPGGPGAPGGPPGAGGNPGVAGIPPAPGAASRGKFGLVRQPDGSIKITRAPTADMAVSPSQRGTPNTGNAFKPAKVGHNLRTVRCGGKAKLKNPTSHACG